MWLFHLRSKSTKGNIDVSLDFNFKMKRDKVESKSCLEKSLEKPHSLQKEIK